MKIRQFIDIVESASHVTLFHGTCADSAAFFMENGWSPEVGRAGGNGGQSRYLYLTNKVDNARWFAEEKGCDTVVSVTLPVSSLIVDPEDGVHDTVEDELNNSSGLPAYLACRVAIPASAFKLISE